MNTSCILFNNLNDDCLANIFVFVNARDRINLEKVCQRWKKLCLPLWKTFKTFDISDKQLGYRSELKKIENAVVIGACQQIFSRSFSYLTKVNLSSADPFHNSDPMFLAHDCLHGKYCNAARSSLKQDQELDALSGVKTPLSQCRNIEELYLCLCMIRADDKILKQVFETNKKLRIIVLSSYKLTEKCLLHLPLESLESIELNRCQLTIIKGELLFEKTFMPSAPKLNSLTEVNPSADYNFASFMLPSSPNINRLNLVRQAFEDPLLSAICSLKNLTYLSMIEAIVDDDDLILIMNNCKKLVVLDITCADSLTDFCLRGTESLPHLKCLGLGFNWDFTDDGLMTLNENLHMLDLSSTNFSSYAILMTLERMLSLEILDVSGCGQLGEEFVAFATDIVGSRPDETPLEIIIRNTSIDPNKTRDPSSSVKLSLFSAASNYCKFIKMST